MVNKEMKEIGDVMADINKVNETLFGQRQS